MTTRQPSLRCLFGLPAAPALSHGDLMAASGPIFRFQTDGFWLNLHHFA